MSLPLIALPGTASRSTNGRWVAPQHPKLQRYLDARHFIWPHRLEITKVSARIAVNLIGMWTKIITPGFTEKVFILPVQPQPFEIIGDFGTSFDYLFHTVEE